MPSQVELPLQKHDIQFHYVVHTYEPHRMVALAGKLRNVDVLLCETVGGSPETRNHIEDIYNLVLAPAPPYLDMAYADRVRAFSHLSQSRDFLHRLVAELYGSGKQMRLVDIDQYHPVYEDALTASFLEKFIRSHIAQGDMEAALLVFKNMCALFASSSKEREHVVSEQVAEMLHSDPKPLRYAVIQGAAHVGTHTLFSRSHAELASTHMQFDVPRCLDLADQITHRLQFLPDISIDEIVYKRACLANFIVNPALAWESTIANVCESVGLGKKVREYINPWSDAQINAGWDAFGDFGRAQREVAKPFDPKDIKNLLDRVFAAN